MKNALKRVLAKMPGEFRADADVKTLEAICSRPHVDIVHLINRRYSYTSSSKDYEFSRATVRQLWEAGLEDVRRTVVHPEWQKKTELAEGIQVYDLTHKSPNRAIQDMHRRLRIAGKSLPGRRKRRPRLLRTKGLRTEQVL
jgi:NTE family protein